MSSEANRPDSSKRVVRAMPVEEYEGHIDRAAMAGLRRAHQQLRAKGIDPKTRLPIKK
jgi:hypothetical protein